MNKWPKHPIVYELNTWVWLHELGKNAGHPVTLGTVPEAELERLAGYGFDALWLMGVWERSPAARRIAREHPGLGAEYRKALPDYSSEDVVGSPYAVHRYRVDSALGGDEELATLRRRLQRLGLRLILDFVPNHLARDHPWVNEHPQRLVQASSEQLIREPESYFGVPGFPEGRTTIFAHGRDPNFPPWTDTVQVDYRYPEARQAMIEILTELTERCDGVRCDMAMLVNREIFLRTWGGAFDPPLAEFWPTAITEVKAHCPEFLMVAEAYWGKEAELQQMGFDYVYDKELYDRLLYQSPDAVRWHLRTDSAYQPHLARFIENHDEQRALAAFGRHRLPAIAALAYTLPGLRLLHQGQIDGAAIKLPIQLGRRHPEPTAAEIERFYRRLLMTLRHPVFHDGEWRLLEPRQAWSNNFSHQMLMAHEWWLGDERRLIVANLAPTQAQCRLQIDLPGLAGASWRLQCLLNKDCYIRNGNEMTECGLYLDMPGYGFHVFEIRLEASP